MVSSESIMKMLEYSYDGIWITDGSGIILYANSANAALLGLRKEALIGKSTQQLLDEHIFSDSVIMEVIKTRKQATRISHNERTDLTVLATATPIFGENGEIEYIFNNVRDITALNNLRDSLKDKDAIIQSQKKQLQEIRTRYGVNKVVTVSPGFSRAVEIAERVAKFDGATVLILGESGTGKELIADIIVRNSQRQDGPFIKVNCGAIPESLLESELFGYEKGAFTGADSKGKPGLFEAANGGTIFLDEIGEMPLDLQAKLLRVLQEKNIRRIGDNKIIPVDVRVISATNVSIHDKIMKGTFRRDLYYRINLLELRLPPLRDRPGDVELIFRRMMERFSWEAGRPVPTITPEAAELMRRYPWYGNVRELRNFCERLTILNEEPVITPAQLKMAGLFELEAESCMGGELLQPPAVPARKRKEDLAREMGISRTTLWRRSKRQEREKQNETK